MDKWNLIIDVALCENCNNCTLAAKDEYVGNTHKGYSAPAPKVGADLIKIEQNNRGQAPVVDTAYRVTMCNHCDNAPCMKVGGDAVRKRSDGIVIIDPIKAKGRKDIVGSCPYGSIIWNEEEQLPQNYIFDAHLLDGGWTEPRLVQSCPTLVFDAFKASDAKMAKRAADEGLETLLPDLGTKPRVYYKNLYRYDKCFIGGTVIADVNGVDDCVEGASITVTQNGATVGIASSDAFGEFKVDHIDPDSGTYDVSISHPVHGAASGMASIVDSQYIGLIKLK